MGSKFAKPKDLLQPPPVCKKGPKRKISTVPDPPPLGCAWDPPAWIFPAGGTILVDLHAFPGGVPDGEPLDLTEFGDLAADLTFEPSQIDSGTTTAILVTESGPSPPGNYSVDTRLESISLGEVCSALAEATLT